MKKYNIQTLQITNGIHTPFYICSIGQCLIHHLRCMLLLSCHQPTRAKQKSLLHSAAQNKVSPISIRLLKNIPKNRFLWFLLWSSLYTLKVLAYLTHRRRTPTATASLPSSYWNMLKVGWSQLEFFLPRDASYITATECLSVIARIN